MKDKKKFLVAMNMLSDYYRQPLTKLAIEAYWVALSELDDVEVDTAMVAVLRTAKFMPSAAEIFESIPPRKTRMELAQEADAAAWRDR